MIRLATYKDLDSIIEIGRAVASEISAHYVVDEFKSRKTLLFLIGARRGCVFVAENKAGEVVGFIAGQVDALWFSKACYATDIAFLVKPGNPVQGFLLAKRFIRWAKAIPDVVDITLNISSGLDTDNRLGRLYERLGLKPMGGCYSFFK
jgi:hypothetical protein